MSESKLRRTAVATLAALCLTASAVIAAAPVHAYSNHDEAPMAERTTNLSACIGSALDAHGFDDVATLSEGHQDAINCLAFYGITVGTTATTYSPHNDVTRAQMALFLHRTAKAAGVDFTPTADDQAAMFSDIDNLGDEWQTAIKALYAKGIMTGRAATAGISGVASSDTFVPSEAISRAEMAVYLRNLLLAASPDLFNEQDGTLAGVSRLDHFPDARTGTPGAVSDAIAEIYELGITLGRGPGEYNPAGFVTRWQMALFITRTLAHTNARPSGVSVQQDGATLVVSERGRDFQPLDGSNTYVDVFTAALDDAEDAFDEDGECDDRNVQQHSDGGYYLCEIDRGDFPLENGDAEVDFDGAIPSDGLAVWLWLGEPGDEYPDDADEDNVLKHVFDGETLPPPAASLLTVTYSGVRTDSNGNPRAARVGSTVTVHVQLQGSYADTPDDLVDVPAPTGGIAYDLELTLYTGEDDTGTPNIDERIVIQRPRASTLTLEADGSASFDLLTPAAHTMASTYTSSFVLTQQDIDAMGADLDAEGEVTFASVGDAVATSVEITNFDRWVDVASIGSRARNVTVTVYDQFGRTMSNEPVLLIADPSAGAAVAVVGDSTPDAAPASHTVRTDRRGEADFRYTYANATDGQDAPAGTVTLRAGIDGDGAPDVSAPDAGHLDDGNGGLCVMSSPPDVDAVDARDVCSDEAKVYYASAAGIDSMLDADGDALTTGESYRILYADTDPRRGEQIVVQQYDGSGAVNDEGPLFVDYSDAQDRELFTDDYDRDDTAVQQRAAFTTALMRANQAAATAARKAAADRSADDYCELKWNTPLRGSWTVDVTNCPSTMA